MSEYGFKWAKVMRDFPRRTARQPHRITIRTLVAILEPNVISVVRTMNGA